MMRLKLSFSLMILAAVFLLPAPLVFAQAPIEATAQNNQAPALDQPGGQALIPSGPSSDSNNSFTGIMDPFDYDQRGRRDPFVEPIPDKPVQQGNIHGPLLPLQKFELSQLALVGIIWDVKHPKAMIKDPTGSTHVVGTNTKVGPRNGYIAVIREGEMVVVETTEQEGKLVSSAQVVKIVH
jgi:type IV pilus assembly protein PilP